MKVYDLNTASVVDSRKLGYIAVPEGVRPFKDCTEEQRIAAGYLPYVMDSVPAHHIAGDPVHVREGDTMRCTWPNAVFDPSLAVAENRASTLAQIADLEAQQTPRRIREAALTAEGRAWLEGLDGEISALREQL